MAVIGVNWGAGKFSQTGSEPGGRAVSDGRMVADGVYEGVDAGGGLCDGPVDSGGSSAEQPGRPIARPINSRQARGITLNLRRAAGGLNAVNRRL